MTGTEESMVIGYGRDLLLDGIHYGQILLPQVPLLSHKHSPIVPDDVFSTLLILPWLQAAREENIINKQGSKLRVYPGNQIASSKAT